MTLPASGAISLRDVNVELGLPIGNPISLNDTAVRTLFGKPSGSISLTDGYGKSSSVFGFDTANTIYVQNSSDGEGGDAYVFFNTTGTITYAGNIHGYIATGSPTAWFTPATVGIGASYEIKMVGNVVTTANIFGVAYGTSAIDTGWVSLDTIKTAKVGDVDGGSGSFTGTVYIRNATTLAEISRACTIYADA